MITITKYTISWNEFMVKEEFPNLGALFTFGYESKEEAEAHHQELDDWNRSNTSVYKVSAQINMSPLKIEKINTNVL